MLRDRSVGRPPLDSGPSVVGTGGGCYGRKVKALVPPRTASPHCLVALRLSSSHPIYILSICRFSPLGGQNVIEFPTSSDTSLPEIRDSPHYALILPQTFRMYSNGSYSLKLLSSTAKNGCYIKNR